MHPVFTKPWSIGTSLIVVVLVLAVPTILLKVGYGDEFTVSWPFILGTIGVCLALGSGDLVKRWAPAKWVIGVILLVILLTVSLLLEPVGKFTFHPNMLVYTAMAVMFWVMGSRTSTQPEQ